MTTFRSIAGIYKGAPFPMVGDGFRVSNFFPGGSLISNSRYPRTDNEQPPSAFQRGAAVRVY